MAIPIDIRWRSTVCMCVVSIAAVNAGFADTQTDAPPSTAPASVPVELPSGKAIQRAVQELNHPSPIRRREAVRRLTMWGPLAVGALERTARGPDLEPALLAGDLLRELGEVVFVGSRVRLEADRMRIRWDEPIAITVVVENPTETPILVPWPTSSQQGKTAKNDLGPAGKPAEDDAQQVGAVMDVADFVTVQGPDGQKVEMRVEPIEHDTAVYQAMRVRAGDHPPSHYVPAGGSERLIVRQFNRGWARFPMLSRGKYVIEFACQPDWKDPAWTAQGIGLVRSNAVTVEVIETAPADVERAKTPLRLALRREGEQITGELQNTWDRDVWLNLNLGGAIETHGRLFWSAIVAKEQEPVPFQVDGDATGPNFDPARIVRLGPGEKKVVAKTTTSAILQRVRSGGNLAGPVTVHLRYVHVSAARDLRTALRAKGRHDSIPTELFNGAVAASPITITITGGIESRTDGVDHSHNQR